MTRRWSVTHRTSYSYDDEVTDSYGVVMCRPRELPWQRLVDFTLTTDPGAGDTGDHADVEGNTASFFHVTEPHRRLTVEARSVVECDAGPGLPVDPPAWERCRPGERRDLPEAALAAEYAAPSPLVDLDPDVVAWAAASFEPGRDVVSAVLDLVHRVHEEFEYRPGSTDVSTRVPDVLAARAGVCQDFAHLTIAGLRGLGLAARYTSGYLATEPPPGRERVVGADATHAWLAVWVPGTGSGPGAATWLAVDPTNDCVVAERHVTVAWGRDYGDVPPVKGVIFTESSTTTMSVSVDVAPAPEDLATPESPGTS